MKEAFKELGQAAIKAGEAFRDFALVAPADEKPIDMAVALGFKKGAVPINSAPWRVYRGVDQAAQRVAKKLGRPSRALIKKGERDRMFGLRGAVR